MTEDTSEMFDPFASDCDCSELSGLSLSDVENGPEKLSEEAMLDIACKNLQLSSPKKFGCGSFGVVYKVTSVSTGEVFALKITSPDVDDKKLLTYAKQEIDIWSKLNHPNIIKVFNSYIGDGFVAVQMELAAMTMTDYVAATGVSKIGPHGAIVKVLTEAQLIPFARDILSALVYMHELGLIHRDIKPSNILLVKNENGFYSAKLGDFLIAADTKGLDSSEGRFNLECSIGTFHYAAPEVYYPALSVDGYDFRCDVWSAGMTFVNLLTGSLPEVNKDKPFLSLEDSKELSESCRDLLCHMLEWKFENRFTSREALQHPFVMPRVVAVELITPDTLLGVMGGTVQSFYLGDIVASKKQEGPSSSRLIWADITKEFNLEDVDDLMIIADNGLIFQKNDRVEIPEKDDIHVLFVPRKNPIPKIEESVIQSACQKALEEAKKKHADISCVQFLLLQLNARYQFCEVVLNKPLALMNHCRRLLSFDGLRSELEKQQNALMKKRIPGIPLVVFTPPKRREWNQPEVSDGDRADLELLFSVMNDTQRTVYERCGNSIGRFTREIASLCTILRDWETKRPCLKHAVDSLNNMLDCIREDVDVMKCIVDYIEILKKAQDTEKYPNPQAFSAELTRLIFMCPCLQVREEREELERPKTSETEELIIALTAKIEARQKEYDSLQEEFCKNCDELKQRRIEIAERINELRNIIALLRRSLKKDG